MLHGAKIVQWPPLSKRVLMEAASCAVYEFLREFLRVHLLESL
jgi:hypothetical protein